MIRGKGVPQRYTSATQKKTRQENFDTRYYEYLVPLKVAYSPSSTGCAKAHSSPFQFQPLGKLEARLGIEHTYR